MNVEDHLMDLFRKIMEVNYFGVVAVTKAFLPMIRQRRGRILINSSTGRLFSGPFWGPYSASKYAVEALSDALRRELDPFGVSVSLLEPGFIMTPRMAELAKMMKYRKEWNIYSSYQLRCHGQVIPHALKASISTVAS